MSFNYLDPQAVVVRVQRETRAMEAPYVSWDYTAAVFRVLQDMTVAHVPGRLLSLDLKSGQEGDGLELFFLQRVAPDSEVRIPALRLAYEKRPRMDAVLVAEGETPAKVLALLPSESGKLSDKNLRYVARLVNNSALVAKHCLG